MPKNKKRRISKFLERQAMIESSGGKNFAHEKITDPSSIHYGASAIGTYGFMPNTVREIKNRYKMAGRKNPKLDLIDSMSDTEMKEYLESNPDLEKELAEFLAERTINRMGGNEEMANYAWQYGHNLTPEKIKKKNYLESDRAKKYKELLDQEQKQARMPVSKPIVKSNDLKISTKPIVERQNVLNNEKIEESKPVDNEFDLSEPDQTENLKRLKKLLADYKK